LMPVRIASRDASPYVICMDIDGLSRKRKKQ
jgi:hypothetical protein